LPWLKALGGRIAAPVAVATGILFPDNENLESNGSVPNHDGLNYRFSEMRLTLIQNDGQDGKQLLFSGLPEKDGSYRDQSGTIVGRAIGNSFMLDNAGVATMSAAQRDGASSLTATEDTSDQPKLCPNPSPDRPSGMSDRAASYQEQITGLPRGMAILFNGVFFDGCRTSDGTLLEAKGPGYEWALSQNGEFFPNFDGEEQLHEQIQRQSASAGARVVEWHFAEARVAQNIESFVTEHGFKNLVILHTPMVQQ